MTHAILGRWGKNIALRFSREIASNFSLREGETVDIEAGPDQIVIRRVRRGPDLAALFAGKRPEEWRALYDGAYDWGPDQGREIVDK